ncbi:MAG TPA: NUDIX domain-containing protein [Candidatus Paceibacterota bacterium]
MNAEEICPICENRYKDEDSKVIYHVTYIPEITTNACRGCNYAEFLIRNPEEKTKYRMDHRKELVRMWTIKHRPLINPNSIPEFGIPKENEQRRDGGCAVVFDPHTQKFAVGKQIEDGLFRLFSGGVDKGENIENGTTREVVEESGLYDFDRVEKIGEAMSHYYNSLRDVNRVAHVTCFLIVLKSSNLKSVNLEEHEKFTLAWATSEEILLNWNSKNANNDYDHWIYFFNKSTDRLRDLGYMN